MANNKKEAPKNTKPVDDSANWDEQTAAFPPYWQAEEGASFIAKFVGIDARDSKFVRYIWQTTRAMNAFTGPVDEQELCELAPGDFFTTGEYSVFSSMNLNPVFIGVEMRVEVTGKRESKSSGNDYYTFSIKTNPQYKSLIATRKEEFDTKQLVGVPAALASA